MIDSVKQIVTLFFYGLWMLCGVSCAVFAADAARRFSNLISLALGLVAGALLVRADRVPDVVWVGGLVFGIAVWRLTKPGRVAGLASSAAAGLMAAIWASLFQRSGVLTAATVPVVLAVVAVSAWMSARDPKFAPPRIHDEALMLLVLLGAVLAVAPGVAAGWQSALALNLEGKGADAFAVPGWTILVMLASVSLGGAYALWTRR